MKIVRSAGTFGVIGLFGTMGVLAGLGACATNETPPATASNATSTSPTSATTNAAPPTTTAPPAPTPSDTTAPPATTAPPPATTTPPAPSTPPASTMPAYEPTPEPKVAAATAKLTIAEGHPKGLKSGAFEAYWVWNEGKHWRLRTTTHDVLHRFHGIIVSEDGALADVKPTRNEWNDRLKATTNRIEFDFHTKGHEDGFDFDAPDDRCLRFYLLIDGKPHADRVNLGKDDKHPPNWHFKLCK